MPKQITQLVNDEIYHLVLRAVGDVAIFNNANDYYRGVFSIYEFNNANPVTIWRRRRNRLNFKKRTKKDCEISEISQSSYDTYVDDRRKLVEVFAFSLMPNHFHLLVKQLRNNGISQFMQKLGGGYANYFNKKYKRKGHLLNQFRAVHIKTDDQFKNVFIYIHANRISLIEPGWKEKGIKNVKKVINFLENDKWHSYPDYLGKENFNSVTNRKFLLEVMNGAGGCRDAVNNWVEYKREPKNLVDVVLE